MLADKDALLFYDVVIVPLCVLIPAIPACLKYRSFSPEFKVLSRYVFLSALANLVTSALAYNAINNMPVLHVYTFLELAVLGAFYGKVFGNSGPGKYLP